MNLVYVTACTFNQDLMATGCGRKNEDTISPLIEWARYNDVELVPMPCSEHRRNNYVLPRVQMGYKKYAADEEFVEICKDHAEMVLKDMLTRMKDSTICGAVGIQGSPSCCFMQTKSVYLPYGVFCEQLEILLKREGLEIPTVSIDVKSSPAAIRRHLDTLIEMALFQG